ncbi:hypothetical protein GP486_007736 [Trichoglossum hirsutum]|uniref:Uncharacterized protein n=1 Tax=Trichoglossum hirsutum TaxID=265104 RepID=A0A9P8L2E5_9PEZI|nr:hypothetical protein GP486_007736 [Trichoglossum hirsutum]
MAAESTLGVILTCYAANSMDTLLLKLRRMLDTLEVATMKCILGFLVDPDAAFPRIFFVRLLDSLRVDVGGNLGRANRDIASRYLTQGKTGVVMDPAAGVAVAVRFPLRQAPAAFLSTSTARVTPLTAFTGPGILKTGGNFSAVEIVPESLAAVADIR